MTISHTHAMTMLAHLASQTAPVNRCPWCRDGRPLIAGFHGGTFHTIESASGFVECWDTVGETVSGEHNHYGV